MGPGLQSAMATKRPRLLRYLVFYMMKHKFPSIFKFPNFQIFRTTVSFYNAFAKWVPDCKALWRQRGRVYHDNFHFNNHDVSSRTFSNFQIIKFPNFYFIERLEILLNSNAASRPLFITAHFQDAAAISYTRKYRKTVKWKSRRVCEERLIWRDAANRRKSRE